MTLITLNPGERAELDLQHPSTSSDGGFQNLLVSLSKRVDAAGNLELTSNDLERIPRYAYEYGNGGWENRLTAIFGRHLGHKLGR